MAFAQTVCIFDTIGTALAALGSSLRDVIRTRIFLRNLVDCEPVTRLHGEVFGKVGIRPANTTVAGLKLIGEDLMVEIEVDAIVGGEPGEVLRIQSAGLAV